jgi:hypothetical protein
MYKWDMGGGKGWGSVKFLEKFAKFFIIFYNYSVIKHISGLHKRIDISKDIYFVL